MAQANEKTDTKLELLLAAERLFATQGIAATSIREINAEAGQKNQSAIHYHFGSREAVVDALVDLRVTPNHLGRLARLEEARARAGDRPLKTEEIVRATSSSRIDQLMKAPGPSYTARFILQLRVNHDLWRRYERSRKAWSLDEIHLELRRSHPFHPPEIVRNRFRQIINMSMTSLAEIEMMQARLGNRFSREEAMFRIEEMIALMCAVIDAPISPATAEALEAVRRSRTSQLDEISKD